MHFTEPRAVVGADFTFEFIALESSCVHHLHIPTHGTEIRLNPV